MLSRIRNSHARQQGAYRQRSFTTLLAWEFRIRDSIEPRSACEYQYAPCCLAWEFRIRDSNCWLIYWPQPANRPTARPTALQFSMPAIQILYATLAWEFQLLDGQTLKFPHPDSLGRRVPSLHAGRPNSPCDPGLVVPIA